MSATCPRLVPINLDTFVWWTSIKKNGGVVISNFGGGAWSFGVRYLELVYPHVPCSVVKVEVHQSIHQEWS